MDRHQLLKRIQCLKTWHRGDQRAPHKPLLVLYALGRWQRGGETALPFQEMEEHMIPLLREFGSPKKQEPLYPYYHLESDGIWDAGIPLDFKPHNKRREPRKTDLRRANVAGGFTDDVIKLLENDQTLARDIALELLREHFPDSLHEDILRAVGLTMSFSEHQRDKRMRDPSFRENVLIAYEYRCAVCGFDIAIGRTPICLEGAHIKWVQHRGPDDITNGLALCVLHHKLLDTGAFSLDDNLKIVLSNQVNGESLMAQDLRQRHGSNLRLPQSEAYYPKPAYIDWHRKEVFKGKPRPLKTVM